MNKDKTKKDAFDKQMKKWAQYITGTESVPIQKMKTVLGEYEKMVHGADTAFPKCPSCRIPLSGVSYHEIPMEIPEKNTGTKVHMLMKICSCPNPACRRALNVTIEKQESIIKA